MHLIFTERSFKENKYFSPTSHIQFVKCEIPLKMSESNCFWTETIRINKPHMSQLRKKIYQQSSPVKT